jgi:NAD+ synthase (glutamine-hydrolysing)
LTGGSQRKVKFEMTARVQNVKKEDRKTPPQLRVALAQFNAWVGDIEGNIKTMMRFYSQAVEAGADVVVFPEMSVCGYPPEDLLLESQFLNETRAAIERLAKDCPEKTIIAGFAEINEKGCFNALAVLADGRIKYIYRKRVLPNYGVFDERRYFRPGTEPVVIDIGPATAALTICEDIWQLGWLDKFLEETRRKDIIINISASPFHSGKIKQRLEVLSRCAKHFECAVAYCNLIGGQDELVFDGRSMFVDSTGKLVSQAGAFAEDLLVADVGRVGSKKVRVKNVTPAAVLRQQDAGAEVYEALVLGTKDYVLKNGFRKVVVGLSGGVDSSLTAAIAVASLGAENVVGITMPSKFNSFATISDAAKVARNLGIEFHTIPIGGVLEKFNETLNTIKGWRDAGVAYENLQARIRGTILMSLSNQFSYLVLTTGNKSETAVGYSTLYGDTAGGFAVIKDVPKTMVYKLAKYVNRIHHRRIIPTSVMERAPTAELKEGQKDTDSLPEYDLLDKIVAGFVEENKPAQELVAAGLPKNVLDKVIAMIDSNEYKRRQSPPGVKITPRAFGKDRRMPITNRYVAH